jgi:Protein of unknown function (DUF2612)
MSTDYTQFITSEHAQQPNFLATVALTANNVGAITEVIDSMPGLFDIDVAVGNQEDIDGLWIGFARTIGGIIDVQFFGFADDASALEFGELSNPALGGRFYDLGEDQSSTATLADPEYRTVLQAKIIQNGWDGSVAEFEAAAADIIPVPCQYLDMGDCVVSILPSAQLDPVLVQLLTGFDLLPRPGGVRYELLGPMATPYTWTTAGTAVGSGSTVTKPSGSNAWDSSAYIASPFQSLWMSWQLTSTVGQAMAGFSSNPSGSPNYPNLNYGFYRDAANALWVYESGTQRGASIGTYTAGDSLSMLCDKSTVYYFHNGQLRYTSLVAVPGPMSPMFLIFTVGDEFLNISIQTGN